MQIVLFDLHRLKENRNLKYAAKVQPFIQITKFWKIILKVLYTQMPVPPTSVERARILNVDTQGTVPMTRR